MILLTPGPLTTSIKTREAMLVDWGSRDIEFIQMCAKIREQLVSIVHGDVSYTCVPLQGSGTFAVEATIGTIVPRDGEVVVLVNGAYGRRIAQICDIIGRRVHVIEWSDGEVTECSRLDTWLQAHPDVTHVAVVHCETSIGIVNPLKEVAEVVHLHKKRLIVDAMSSFGALPIDVTSCPAIDAIVAASGKCLEGTPGVGFVIAKAQSLIPQNAHSLVLDLQDQYFQMEKTGQWRFTPPTSVMAALYAALSQFEVEGGQEKRLERYTNNYNVLSGGLRKLGLRQYVKEEFQAPIIVTFYSPKHANWDFNRFFSIVRSKGFILYPGKLTSADTFRVGCIGDVKPEQMQQAVYSIGETLKEMGIDIYS